MNKIRRKEILKALNYLGEAVDILSEVKEEEDDAYNNLPEGIQNSEKGEQMEEAINILEEALGYFEDYAEQLAEL